MKNLFPAVSKQEQAAAAADRAIFEVEYKRFWDNYCRLVTEPDRRWFDVSVGPLISLALGFNQTVFLELWFSA